MIEINKNLLNQLYDKYKDLPLLVNEKQSWTFAEFFNKAFLLSNSLNTEPKKRIGLCSENYEFLLFAMTAIWMREGIVVPLDPKFPPKQKEELLQKVNCNFSFSENYKQKISKSKITKKMPLLKTDSWSTIIFTSGSSGFPKAVIHTLANHFFSALGANRVMPLNPGDRWLMSLPLFHVGGLAIFFRSLISGASIVIPAKNKSLIQNIEKNKVTHLSLVPTQLQRILKTGEGRESLHKLKLILIGGSTIPESLIEHFSNLGLKIQTTYGSTEMASQVATSSPVKTI
jgi:O-succinylbenzoic acid--CoA ligase